MFYSTWPWQCESVHFHHPKFAFPTGGLATRGRLPSEVDGHVPISRVDYSVIYSIHRQLASLDLFKVSCAKPLITVHPLFPPNSVLLRIHALPLGKTESKQVLTCKLVHASDLSVIFISENLQGQLGNFALLSLVLDWIWILIHLIDPAHRSRPVPMSMTI
jgi:hypothetical protein